ncbi:MAG: hypothetical protein PHQ58_21175 [Rhodoferax sp.]|uniref:hypothetical protein n=1 Tax=Rhodoferax sp. TaxID=50421 RepID=UPI00261FD2A2|nr:hypothetical protein [Rhodoferax sp.]MDD2882931.1 hypothetical protein [Rhodoferax sp.]
MTKTLGIRVDKPMAPGFFASRWRGEVFLSRLYWRDILIVGSVINLYIGFVALMIAAKGGALWVSAMVHFAILPYNLFLVLALWRTPGRSNLMVWTSLAWLGAATML